MKTSTLPFRHLIHQKIIDKLTEAENWLLDKSKGYKLPFYSSFDIRESQLKVACVDANVFPAGFNNICEEDQKRTSELIKIHLRESHSSTKHILLLAEEHTRNLYYWDNILVIKSLIEQAGFPVTVCVPGKKILSPQKIVTASGRELFLQLLHSIKKEGVVISNNDFSDQYDLPLDREYKPPIKMGWLFRKKHRFFKEYNLLAEEFAGLLGIEPWRLKIETELFSPFDMKSQENVLNLKSRLKAGLQKLKSRQKKEDPFEEPYLFLKNNSGTYGLGVMAIKDPESFERFSWKARKKMSASKGEAVVKEIIIQEGIPTTLQRSGNAEPVIYMIGCQVAGGFLRSHKTKDHKANLNSPGAVFRRLCMSDLEIKIQGLVMENVYSWIAKLGVLALSREMDSRGEPTSQPSP